MCKSGFLRETMERLDKSARIFLPWHVKSKLIPLIAYHPEHSFRKNKDENVDGSSHKSSTGQTQSEDSNRISFIINDVSP